MDDYTWRKKLAERRRRARRERFFLVLVFAIFIGCAVAYFAVYTKSPEYAAEKIFESLEKKDVEYFRNHLDLNALTASAYDDLTGDLFKYDTRISAKEKSLFENFYVLIRPQLCKGAIKVINEKLDSGKWTLPEEILKGRQLGIDFDLLLERSLLRHTSVVAVDKVTHLGNNAVAEVKVVEDYSQMPFTLKIRLDNANGRGWQVGEKTFSIFGTEWKFDGFSFSFYPVEWKVVKIENYRDYLDAVRPILMKDLADYIASTSEIVNRYNAAFRNERNIFAGLQRTTGGVMDEARKARVADYIENNLIPLLQSRQAELDGVNFPKGAFYLAALRRESTAVTIQAWREYRRGLLENSGEAFDTAESLLKQELILDQRIEEIVHNSAIAKNLPEVR